MRPWIVQYTRLDPARATTPCSRLSHTSVECYTLSIPMKTTTLTIPELILIAGTRALLGAGLALLISNRLTAEQRQTAGVVLTAVGILTTFPLAAEAFGKYAAK